jgi:hypothetical protein
VSGFRQPHVITRHTGASNVNGFWAGGTTSQVNIMASVQPAPGKTRKNVPEGFDSDSAYLLFTDTELFSAIAGGQHSDELTLFGETFEVVGVATWQNNVLPHYEVTVARRRAQS